MFSKWDGPMQSDNSEWLITLTVITLTGNGCNNIGQFTV
jgi:hypothetical protein